MQRSGIQVGKIELGILMTNFYYLYREEGRGEGGKPQKTPVICIDPADHGEEIYETLTGQGLVPEVILLTHAHFDHIRGVQALQRLSGAPVYCYKEEKELCEDPDKNGSAAYGHPITVQPSAYLSDGGGDFSGGTALHSACNPRTHEGQLLLLFSGGRLCPEWGHPL